MFLVKTRYGGETRKVFNNKRDAEKYYVDNINYNSIIKEIKPFKLDNEQMYYNLENNCISIYNKNYEYITSEIINGNIKEPIEPELLLSIVHNYIDRYILPY